MKIGSLFIQLNLSLRFSIACFILICVLNIVVDSNINKASLRTYTGKGNKKSIFQKRKQDAERKGMKHNYCDKTEVLTQKKNRKLIIMRWR